MTIKKEESRSWGNKKTETSKRIVQPDSRGRLERGVK